MAASRISIHTPHARSDDSRFKRREGRNLISIHAPHARSDAVNDLCGVTSQAISIHAPHARSDHGQLSLVIKIIIISIHAPHARSDLSTNRMRLDTRISIHAPHARSALAEKAVTPHYTFQSTLLMRGATWRVACRHPIHDFNPRSSCEERPRRARVSISSRNFNPRSSCEERPDRFLSVRCSARLFQSTLLMRGATGSRSIRLMRYRFQSTLLMRGATLVSALSWALRINFNPRSSCEERRIETVMEGWKDISIHAPHARSDHGATTPQKVDWSFQSTLLMRGATCRSGCEVRGCR